MGKQLHLSTPKWRTVQVLDILNLYIQIYGMKIYDSTVPDTLHKSKKYDSDFLINFWGNSVIKMDQWRRWVSHHEFEGIARNSYIRKCSVLGVP